MNPSTPLAERARSSVSRRTVVVGTAWAVPAVVVASAAPAMAASVTVTVTQVCRVGNLFTVTLKVTGAVGSTVTINSVNVGGVSVNVGTQVVVGATGSTTVLLPGVTAPDFPNGKYSVSVSTSAGTAEANVTLKADGCVTVP